MVSFTVPWAILEAMLIMSRGSGICQELTAIFFNYFLSDFDDES
jgi:hypothetical protein